MADEPKNVEGEEPAWAKSLLQAMNKLTEKLTAEPQQTEQVVEVQVPPPPAPPEPQEVEIEELEEEIEELEQETPPQKKKSFLDWLF